MPVTDLLTRACTIRRRTAGGDVDDYGDAVAVQTTAETVCELQQARRSEPDDQGEFSSTEWRLFLPAGTVLDTSDVVEIDGEAFEVVGDPWAVRNPRTQETSHMEATVKRAGG